MASRTVSEPPFTAAHDELRAEIRAFVEGELRPHAAEWEDARSDAGSEPEAPCDA